MERRREREDAERSHAVGPQHRRHLGEARLVVDARHDERSLRLPHDARGGLGHRKLEVGQQARLERGEGVQTHDVAFRIVEHDRQPVEAGDPAEQPGQVAEEALQVAM